MLLTGPYNLNPRVYDFTTLFLQPGHLNENYDYC